MILLWVFWACVSKMQIQIKLAKLNIFAFITFCHMITAIITSITLVNVTI
jgi:hypothetical protein